MNAYEWLYGPYLYDYHLYYPAYQYVITDILIAIIVNGWPYQCISGNQSMYVSMYYIQSYFFSFFLLLLKLFLLYFLVVK